MDKINPIFVIKQMLENNSFNREQLLDILESFKDDIPVVPILLLNDQKVLRTRSNEDDFFGFVHELSYPPAEFARTDRASLSGAPMFYATAFTKNVDKTHAYPRIVSALETMPLFRKKRNPNLCKYNLDLKENIYINHTSLIETAGRASLTYLSTLAVLQLDAILQNAKLQFVDKPKPGNKHQAKFEKMLGMQYSCPGIGDVRLMVGVRKRDKTKIQYCITSLIPVSRMKKEQP